MSKFTRFIPLAVSAVLVAAVAWAAQTNYLGTVFIADSTVPSRQVTVSAGGELSVNCTTGCAGGSASNASDNVATSADNGKTNAWLYAWDGAAWDRLTVDGSGYLNVNVAAGGGAGGTSSSFGAAFPATGTAIGMSQGGNMVALSGTAGNLLVNCAVGCSGGTFNNNADNVATSSTNGQSAAWLYGWDGAAWDRMPGTSAGGLTVDLGSNNDVTVTNATATNLKAEVVGTGTFAAQVTNATAANLKAEVVGAVTSADAAALTASLKTYSTTAVYNGTTVDMWREAVNSLNSTGVGLGSAQAVGQCDDTTPTSLTENQFGNLRMNCTTHALLVGGPDADDAAATSNFPVPVGGKYNSTRPSYTDGDRAQNLYGSRGGLLVGIINPDSTQTATVSTAGADAISSGSQLLYTLNFAYLYNGTSFDRWLSAANSLNSTGTGLSTAAQVGQCDDTSPTALTENSFGNARVDCATHAQVVTIAPSATAGGATLATLTAANSTNATNLKASAGQLYGLSGYTISATPAWLSLYNTSGTPTCGTAIIQQYLIPGSTSGAGFNIEFTTPKQFATGIGYCITTGIAGTGSVAASSYVVNFDYK